MVGYCLAALFKVYGLVILGTVNFMIGSNGAIIDYWFEESVTSFHAMTNELHCSLFKFYCIAGIKTF